MLSVLIPTYNQNVTKLVTALQKQATEQGVDFEIIVMEDGSVKYVDENSAIAKLQNCRHIILNENIGRSAVRNKLADVSKYDSLLFIDCDAQVCDSDFIGKYLIFCHDECVVIGGTAYDEKTDNPDFSLRLKYGRVREARPASERDKNNFATFNFLISKSIFNKIRFDETIRSYGYEDMLFGHELGLLSIVPVQIQNPLIHTGLDNNIIFLEKTETGVLNLYKLYISGKYPFLSIDSKLLNAFTSLKKYRLLSLISLFYSMFSGMLKKQLSGSNPSLLIYDIYKIMYMCKISK